MKNKIVGLFICMLFFTTIFPLNVSSVNSCEKNVLDRFDVLLTYGSTITVDDDGPADFSNIQDAINASSAGDTVFVFNGTYNENIIVDKSINLTGESKDSTIINSSSDRNIVNLSADNVQMNGFTVQRDGNYGYYPNLYVKGANCLIFDNVFSIDNAYNYPEGLFVSSSGNIIHNNSFVKTGLIVSPNDLEENFIVDNIVNGEPLVYLDSVSDVIIDSAGQVVMRFCNNVTISKVEIENTPCGVMFFNCDNCELIDSVIRNNDDGVVCRKSDGIVISGNNIQGNIEGIFMLNCIDVIITGNDIHLNSQCIYSQYCSKVDINLNNLYSNGFCLNLVLNDLDRINQNNFGNNIRNVFSLMCSLNSYDNNYWDRPRYFPKLIFEFPRINFDWHPAKSPFEI